MGRRGLCIRDDSPLKWRRRARRVCFALRCPESVERLCASRRPRLSLLRIHSCPWPRCWADPGRLIARRSCASPVPNVWLFGLAVLVVVADTDHVGAFSRCFQPTRGRRRASGVGAFVSWAGFVRGRKTSVASLPLESGQLLGRGAAVGAAISGWVHWRDQSSDGSQLLAE